MLFYYSSYKKVPQSTRKEQVLFFDLFEAFDLIVRRYKSDLVRQKYLLILLFNLYVPLGVKSIFWNNAKISFILFISNHQKSHPVISSPPLLRRKLLKLPPGGLGFSVQVVRTWTGCNLFAFLFVIYGLINVFITRDGTNTRKYKNAKNKRN